MRNIAITVLSVVLAAAIVSGLILYREYSNTKDVLLICERKSATLNEKMIQLNQETSALHDQIRKNAERLKELERAQTLISELENAIITKDQATSEFEKMIRIVQKNLEQERKTREAVDTELAAKEALVTELQERLQGSQSNTLYLEEQIAQERNKIQGLEGELLALKGEKATAEAKMGQLKSTYEALISKHVKELASAKARISELDNAITMKDQIISESEETLRTVQRDVEQERKTREALRAEVSSKVALITELQGGLQGSQSHIRSLKDEIAGYQNDIQGLEGKLLALRGEKATAEAKIGQLKSTYEALISDLKKQIENQEVTIEAFEEKISVTFVDRILFEFGEATISAEGRMILKRVGDILKKVQERKIRVVGHSDNIPILPEYRHKFPSNWELSSARAAAAVRHFQKTTGLDPGNLEAVGRSFYDPVASNETPEGRAQNRRVEIIIAPTIE